MMEEANNKLKQDVKLTGFNRLEDGGVINPAYLNDDDRMGSDQKRKYQTFDAVNANEYVNSSQTQSSGKQRTTRSGRRVTNQLSINNSPEKQSSDTNEPESEETCEILKPDEGLFEEDEDGQAIYSFRTPKRQNGMVTKASDSVKSMDYTPRRESFPGRGRGRGNLYNYGRGDTSTSQPPKTPYGLRAKIRKRLADEVAKQEVDRLLEDSESDFVPSSSDSESESESSSDSDSDDVLHDVPIFSRLNGTPNSKQPSSTQESQKPPVKTKSKKMKDYIFQSDDYFDRQYAKIMTSNNRLSKLKNPKMAPKTLSSILKKIEKRHEDSYQNLESAIERSFKRWLFAFSEGFNVMLYGLGSKMHILKHFHSTCLKDSYVFCVRGFFPDNTMKEMFSTIVTTFLGKNDVPSLPHEVLELIRKSLESKHSLRIFILIANLDGKFLQNEKSQALFSQLLKIPKIHLLASVDHINSPLLWDQSKLSAYNFIWEDATTFSPYTEETSYESSLMVNWSGGMALSSIKNVFTSLTTNSRKVFKILLKYHLENIGGKYSGMHFSDLYRECRSGFVVSSDLSLRTLLTEFMDHQLVKWKKETDHLLITVETPVLLQFQAEMDYLS